MWKYFVPPGFSSLPLPKGAKVMSVGVQYDQAYLWALVDSDERTMEPVLIVAEATGAPLRDVKDSEFIGTVTVFGNYVMHIFVREKELA